MRNFLLAVATKGDHVVNAVTGKGYGFNGVSFESKRLFRVKCALEKDPSAAQLCFYFDTPDQFRGATGYDIDSEAWGEWKTRERDVESFVEERGRDEWALKATKLLRESLARRVTHPYIVYVDTLERCRPPERLLLRSVSQ